MNLVKLLALIRALFKGQILLKAEGWKQVQGAANALVAIAVAVLPFFPKVVVSEADVLAICLGIVTAVNLILTYATTAKVGLPAKGPLYDKVMEKTEALNPIPTVNHYDAYDDWMRSPYKTGSDQSNVPVQNPSRDNSVNAGGKGLLGGNG